MKLPIFRLSSGQLILVTSLLMIILNNGVFFSLVTQRLDVFSLSGIAYIVTFYALMVGLISALLLIFAHKYFLKASLIIFLILSALISYFNQQLGVLFDVDMIRNIIETIKDNNQQEALELASLPLILHVVIFGLLPALLVIWIPVNYKKPLYELGSRFAYIMLICLVILIMLTINFKYISYFSRENRDLRVWLTPLYPITSLYKYIGSHWQHQQQTFQILGTDARQYKSSHKRTVGIMVVGETARADHFSINGYHLETNPYLSKENLINLHHVSSCGTSTAFSVPCMFSFLDREQYSPDKADRQSNVLDTLSHAGVKTVWIDNNSSCKGVCSRIERKNIRNHPNIHSIHYSDGEYYDEQLLMEMQPYIDNNQADTLIILHTLGSHGPAYHRRFPEKFAKFTPYCKSSSPQSCSDIEVSNAYDNTILYTDYILSQLIQFLKQHQQQYESFLVYASDHGESLGENGVYLHGLPYFIAPEAQTHIPLLAWFSDNFITAHHINLGYLRSKADQPYSHDNLSHSLLNLFNVKTTLYQPKLDLFTVPIQSSMH